MARRGQHVFLLQLSDPARLELTQKTSRFSSAPTPFSCDRGLLEHCGPQGHPSGSQVVCIAL